MSWKSVEVYQLPSPPVRLIGLRCKAIVRRALDGRDDMIHLRAGCCDPFNDKALRASRAVPFHLPVGHGSWLQLTALMSQHELVCLAAQPHEAGAADTYWPALQFVS